MAEELHLFNTMTRKKERFEPQEPGLVRLYTCGPTVYHYAHIGNLRTYVFEDILVRALRLSGLKVTHVMNITDVGHLVSDGDDGEDKMETGSKREGKSAWDIAKFYTDAFFRDTERLNVIKPEIIPLATDHIPEMIAIIRTLEEKGFTYKTSDGIYYDTEKLPDYGKLAKLDRENLDAGHRVEMREKKSASDFALWKFSAPNEKRQMEWDSPWGKGFPGWHIECSAMSMKYLGETLDIHCGGKDHVPVHHTNEIAQSEAATGKEFSRVWMHGEFLTEDKAKVSKSAGTVLTLDYLISQGYDPLAYRFLILQAHYRTELNFHWEGLKSAEAGFRGLKNRLIDLARDGSGDQKGVEAYRTRFRAAIFDDLNTAIALSVLFDAVKDPSLSPLAKVTLAREFDLVLGLGLEKDIVSARDEVSLPSDILELAKGRDAARTAKDWNESDRLRKLLEAKGYKVVDTPQGTRVEKLRAT
jgi:cysteinyl-tRNA synthetase